MEPHFYNPIPSDYNSDKVKFWPFDYDFDNNQPKRFEEKKWVETDKYINSKEGNNILDKGNVDKLQTFYDHLFVQMDDRMEHTEMKPPYEYEKSMRKGELLASHVYIYDKSGDELQLRPFSNLSLINITVTDFKIASENYIYFENATVENIIASEHSENGLQNSEIILENCSSLKEIKELKWCKIRIRNSDISNLQIKDNQDCEFFIESGSASAKSEFLKNNTGCLFDFKSVTSSNQYLSKGNQNCMIRFDGVTMSNTEAFNENDTLRGEMIDSTAQGCNWLHNGDKNCDYWYEGHSSSGILQGCLLENSKQFFNKSSNEFSEKLHIGSGLHVSYDESTINGGNILDLENSYTFISDSDISGNSSSNFKLLNCEIVSFGSNLTVSGADNFDSQDSYIDLIQTQVQASGGINTKSTNSFLSLRKSSQLNTDDRNTYMTGGGLSIDNSQTDSSGNSISGSELRSLIVTNSQINSSANSFSVNKVANLKLYESEFSASTSPGSINNLGKSYIANNSFNSPETLELIGSNIGDIKFHNNNLKKLSVSDSLLEIEQCSIDDEITINNCITKLSNTDSENVTVDGYTLGFKNSFTDQSIEGTIIQEKGSSENMDIEGSGLLNNVSGSVSLNGNINVNNVSNVKSAEGILSSNGTTIGSVTGIVNQTGANDPGITGLKTVNLEGETSITSSKTHYDKSDVLHHTKAPTIDHN